MQESLSTDVRKPNIVWYTLCWNEIDILPFMIDYWRAIASKVVVFDNNSTDGSLELMGKYDWIEIRPYPIDPRNTIDDGIHQKIKNSCWKEMKDRNVDWVIVSDLDETVWARDLFAKLARYKEEDAAIITPRGYDFVTETFPMYDGRYAHEIIRTCGYDPKWLNKPIIFDPDKVDEINYIPGGHSIDKPVFRGTNIRPDNFYYFHFKHLSLEYLIRKYVASRPRLSETNLRNGWGFQYRFDRERTKQFFDKKMAMNDTVVEDLLKS